VPLAVLAALLVPQLVAGVLASRERLVLAPREDAVTRPTWTREAMMAYEVSLDPWDDARDWFTPADATQPATQDPKDGRLVAGREPNAG
jgi:hypothetical protein